MRWLIYYVSVINVVSFLVYSLDKWKAKTGRWRIPERTLLLLALAGGSAGALAAMLMFRHKTKKVKFVISIPVMLVIHCVIICAVILRLLEG